MGIDVQAEKADIADKIAELAYQQFRLPLTINATRLKRHDDFPEGWEKVAREADLCFDLTSQSNLFEAACRDPSQLANAFGVMEALCEKVGGKKNGSPPRALYLIQAGEDPIVKIGVSANPLRRLMDLQASHYRELFLWGVIFTPEMKAMTLEQRLLECAQQRGDRLMGEWVAAEPSDLFREILGLAAQHKIAICNAEVWLHNMMERTKRIAKSTSYRGLAATGRRVF